MTSEEYSILLIQPKPGDGKISNQRGKVPQACSYTVAAPQRQPENANSNLNRDSRRGIERNCSEKDVKIGGGRFGQGSHD